jgi:hypothetical protein
MILIAHRGLFEGPNQELENHPDQITLALESGFNAEIDVRWSAGKWWLGHDEAQYEVTEAFLMQPGLWLHCKNVSALTRLLRLPVNCFWHQEDDYTITSAKYVWAYPGQVLPDAVDNGIWVQPEWTEGWRSKDDVLVAGMHVVAGVCSKYVGEIKRRLPFQSPPEAGQ